MKYLNLAILLLAFSSTAACKKDKDPDTKPEPDPVTYPNYSNLKIGNYWIYQWFDVDKDGNATAVEDYDSSYVEKDTLINNKFYYKLRTEGDVALTPVIFLRDSLHYLVDEKGNKLFSSADFNNIIRTFFAEASPGDTIYKVEVKMKAQKENTNVPAGNFTTLSAESKIMIKDKWRPVASPRYTQRRYAENVGLISESFIWGIINPGYTEIRLIRYKVN